MSAQTLGFAYLEEFKLEDAEKEFLKYIELTPDDKIGYANLGLTYLKMGKYPAAEDQLFKAIKIDSSDADIRLILATVYQMNDQRDKAIAELSKALGFDPNHIIILYQLSEMFSVNTEKNSEEIRKNYLLKLVKKAPENLVPKLNLTEIYIRQAMADKAVEQLEIIHKQFPEFPKEAIVYFDKTFKYLKNNDSEKALTPFLIFHNYLKVTAPYQEGINDLKGPGSSLVRPPIINYTQKINLYPVENKSLLKVIKFTDVTSLEGLHAIPTFTETNGATYKNTTHVEAADYDGDGNADLYIGNFDNSSGKYKHYLFKNDGLKFNDLTQNSGINHSGTETSAIFADYDNDGFLDLYITKSNGDVLYRNDGKDIFKNVTSKSNIGNKTDGNKAIFCDLDHDGDLDLFKSGSHSNTVFRNNGDGTFLEQCVKMGLAGKPDSDSKEAAFGDFDDDGDIDLFVVNQQVNNVLYSNQRQGIFKDVTSTSGLKNSTESSAVAAGDYNNNGFLDLFVTSLKGENCQLYNNTGVGKFEIAKSTAFISKTLQNVTVYDAKFFDFDNDGFLDIVVSGESNQKNGRGLFLFHNSGNETFTNVSDLLPNDVKSGKEIALFDLNNDGDLDMAIAGIYGGVSILRNDGGSLNHHINMKLIGLRTGSAKNNFFGIGAKIEMRAGNLYQTRIVTEPEVFFGIGNLPQVDVIRIIWTNGVPQNIFLPDANQALIEAQTLKGSCPFLYTWNGEKYVFSKDIIWRSALGMPLGIMGENLKHTFSNASDDYIKIESDEIKPKDGKYTLQVTSELWETIYIDKIQLLAVDHPDSIDVFVPEQFAPPPFPGLKIYATPKKIIPVSAKDSEGKDLLPFISKKDNSYISDFQNAKFQGVTTMHDLILDPGTDGIWGSLFLYLNGWVFPTDASINMALSQSDQLKVTPPYLQVMNKKGNWETAIQNLGFPMGKDKTVIADLSGKFITKDHRVRIVTNMEIYWDYIFFSNENPKAQINSTILNPVTADLHYRGFSDSYRKGGRYGPHWFDYYNVDTNRKWRDLTGNYTRYGDVQPLLLTSDNEYIISNAGDETTISFNANQLPALKKGWKRDFFIHSVGWVKDGDLNTVTGSTVLPLPYHGMSSYPPSEKDAYPDTPELQQYNKKYNTRIITTNDYKNFIKKGIND